MSDHRISLANLKVNVGWYLWKI